MNQTEPTYHVPPFTVMELATLMHSVKTTLCFWRKAKTPNARQYVRECVSVIRKLKQQEVA